MVCNFMLRIHQYSRNVVEEDKMAIAKSYALKPNAMNLPLMFTSKICFMTIILTGPQSIATTPCYVYLYEIFSIQNLKQCPIVY